ncbi:hypothetical protein HHK36_029325 [Tetracentron sinense]|uniref:FHA domain-containing protein n=1 Tax=Tetracentron sinense TaxID=13715 RepID=A0A835CZ87_TETSI|nr:hypothetical protein HHK36_029325 [Tetracentron sinense]
MVSTRRSGSFSSNISKRSSSSEEKPSSPKRQKIENGAAAEKSTQTSGSSENLKELSSSPAPDPVECAPIDPPIPPVVSPTMWTPESGRMRPHRRVFADSGGQVKKFFLSMEYVSEAEPEFGHVDSLVQASVTYSQNPDFSIPTPLFTIGSNRHCNFPLKDQTFSANLCKIKQTSISIIVCGHGQRDGSVIAMLESTGSKGCVQVNGTMVKKNTTSALYSGDEVIFGLSGNHAYIFQQLTTEAVAKILPSVGVAETQSSAGKDLQLERRSGDSSAVAGASILASLSSSRQDLSLLTPPTQNTVETHQGTKMPVNPLTCDGMEIDLDCLEMKDNSDPSVGSDNAAELEQPARSMILT